LPVKLSTTIGNIETISNENNRILVKEFYEFMKSSGTSDKYQNNNLKTIIAFGKFLEHCIVNHAMNYNTDTESDSSGSDVSSENTKAIKEIQVKLNEIVPSLQDSINLTTIKDLESRVSNLEEKVDQIFKILESRKIN